MHGAWEIQASSFKLSSIQPTAIEDVDTNVLKPCLPEIIYFKKVTRFPHLILFPPLPGPGGPLSFYVIHCNVFMTTASPISIFFYTRAPS